MPARGELLWPWWVRLTHWLVAAGVIALWLMSYVWYETDWLHRAIGYAVLAVVAGRMIAGCMTRMPSARFHLPGWRALQIHVREMQQGQVTPHQGHNPLGQWSVYLMWLLIGGLALTGWLSRTDVFWGEDWPVDMHALLSMGLLLLILVHVLAVMVVSRLSGQNLLSQMIHGHVQSIKKASD